MPIDSLATLSRDSWTHLVGSSDPPTTEPPAASPAGPDTEAAYDRASAGGLLSRQLTLSVVVARMNAPGTKLDELKDQASGPYQVAGALVSSGPQFRMVGGYNEGATKNPDRLGILYAAAARAGVTSELYQLQTGRGRPSSLVKLTQALIDMKQLPGGSAPVADQIHDLQWRFGIGMDCAGYVYRAVQALVGDPAKLGLKTSAFENFRGLPQNRHFERVDATAAQTGDIMVLAGTGTVHDPGHNLIVRSNSTVADPTGARLDKWPEAQAFVAAALAKTPPVVVRALEVDSSFSAQTTGRTDGGVRRDLLLFDGASWCTCKDTHPPVSMTTSVPYLEEKLTGVFRAKTSVPQTK